MKHILQRFILMMLMAVVIGITFALVFDWLQPQPVAEVPAVQAPITPVVESDTVAPLPPAESRDDLTGDEETVVEIVDRLKHAIVSVNTFGNFRGQHQLLGAGSGVAFEQDEDYVYIMTNNHVVADGNAWSIDLLDGGEIPAEVVGTDADTEIAVMRLNKNEITGKLDLAPLADSSSLVVGENVLAIGNALGYGQSVTRGIISAIDRTFEDYRGSYAYKLIQTDAAINPGNSGGALVNMKGEVIGINTLKIGGDRVEGMGFAIPIQPAREISSKLMELGYLPKTFIGVASQYIDPFTLKQNDLPLGTLVWSVSPGSPAEQAGIRREDIIIKVDDTPTPDPETLGSVIRSHQPGDEVIVTIFRAGQTMELPVTLAETTQ